MKVTPIRDLLDAACIARACTAPSAVENKGIYMAPHIKCLLV